ncbi:unnamed protein product [Arabidopsis halleri]
MELGKEIVFKAEQVGFFERRREQFCGWEQKALTRTRSALEVELEAMRWAILTMTRFNYRKMIFESLTLQVVNLIKNGEYWPAFAPTIQDIQSLLLQFQEAKVIFPSRGSNGLADRVAKESLSYTNYDPKLYSIMPNWIKQFVMVDKLQVYNDW